MSEAEVKYKRIRVGRKLKSDIDNGGHASDKREEQWNKSTCIYTHTPTHTQTNTEAETFQKDSLHILFLVNFHTLIFPEMLSETLHLGPT